MNIRSHTVALFLLGLLGLGTSGCSDFLNPQPRNSLSPDQVFSDAAGASAALIGTYGALTSANYQGVTYLAFADLAADNLAHIGSFPTWAQVKNRSVLPDNADITNMWARLYEVVNRANNVTFYAPSVANITDTQKTQVIAEAQFLRAVAYFDLTRFWGDIPLVLTPTTGPGPDLNVARSAQSAVYDQIAMDLTAAESVLPEANTGRATKWAATALKARLALYRENWQDAANFADQVIASNKFQMLPSYRAIFDTENSAESIWSIQFEATGNRSFEAFYMVPGTLGGRGEVTPVSTTLPDAYEAGDKRKPATISDGTFVSATGAKYPVGVQVKYTSPAGDDNVHYLRYAEVLLIGAEAKAHLGKTDDALALLNRIRTRAGLPASTATGTALLDAIAKDRRLELALEGHRWFDLKRTGKAQSVLNITDPNKLLFPVPLRELQNNPNMTQNPGY